MSIVRRLWHGDTSPPSALSHLRRALIDGLAGSGRFKQLPAGAGPARSRFVRDLDMQPALMRSPRRPSGLA